MKKYSLLFEILLFVILIFVFNLLEYEPLNQTSSKYFQSIIFSATLTVSIFHPTSRLKLLYLALIFLVGMTGFYLINQLALSNSLASIGIGILFLVLITYIPQIVKKGEVEKL